MYYFLYLYQVNHFSNHAAHSRIIFMFHRMLQLAQSQGANGILLILGTPNRAFYIFYTQFSHDILLPGRPRLWPATAAATPVTATTAASITAAAATTASITAITAFAPASAAPGARAVLTRFFFANGTRLSRLLGGVGGCDDQPFGLLLANDLADDLAAPRSFGLGRTQFLQPSYARLQRIGGVGASQRLGEDIADADSLNYRAHGATGDDACARSRRFEQHLRGAEAVLDHKRNGGPHHRNLDQVLLGIFDALADGFGILSGLAQAKADMATAISDDHERANAKTATTLDNFGNAPNLYDGLFKIQF
jgi:hypothetical protein